MVRPELLDVRGAPTPMFIAALLLVPVALLLEYTVHTLAKYRTSRRLIRGITVPRFWQGQLSPLQYVLLELIVVGEEIIYRQIWLGVLEDSLGLPVLSSLAISSVFYGLNHLYFGATSVLSKTLTGLLYGGLYVLGGRSIWLPIATHGLQNLALLTLARDKHA